MMLHGIDIDPGAQIHPSTKIIHTVGVVVGADSRIGPDCWIWSNVVLGGHGSRNRPDGHPTLMRGVAVGAGAKVLGPVVLGEGATVGANAVVLTDVAPGDTVTGSPARPAQKPQS
jgi:serine O-acetyltransferase